MFVAFDVIWWWQRWRWLGCVCHCVSSRAKMAMIMRALEDTWCGGRSWALEDCCQRMFLSFLSTKVTTLINLGRRMLAPGHEAFAAYTWHHPIRCHHERLWLGRWKIVMSSILFQEGRLVHSWWTQNICLTCFGLRVEKMQTCLTVPGSPLFGDLTTAPQHPPEETPRNLPTRRDLCVFGMLIFECYFVRRSRLQMISVRPASICKVAFTFQTFGFAPFEWGSVSVC